MGVAGGYDQSLGLKIDGSIVAWGCGGPVNYTQCDVPSPNAGFTAVAGGYFHSLGLKAVTVTCPCNANVNADGSVNVIDEAIVLDCVNGNCNSCVNSCDVNCDGAVDWVDMGIVRCQLSGFMNCCNAATGACMGLHAGSDYEPCVVTTAITCQFFGGTYYGNGSTCVDVCPANRIFEDANYCPGRVDLVRLDLGTLAGVSAIAVADTPPASWAVSAISNGG